MSQDFFVFRTKLDFVNVYHVAVIMEFTLDTGVTSQAKQLLILN